GMCSGWRVAVAVAAIRICAGPRCGSGPVRPLPISEVESVCVGSQSPVTVVRRGSGLSCRARIILSANATMPVLHVSVSCEWSNAFLAYASQAPFLDTPTMRVTRGSRTVDMCSRASTVQQKGAYTHAAVDEVSVYIVLSVPTAHRSVSALVHEFRTAGWKFLK
ncbi:hypothetical protein TcCL_NonESM11125, partial [Trypanosoma cruzi]